jgi:protease I
MRRSENMDELNGAQVAFLVANEGVEQIELTEPWKAIESAGGLPRLIAPKAGSVQAFNHLDKADTFPVDLSAGAASAGDYIGLVLPGGVANPDQLRTMPDAVSFAKAFVDEGKPVAVICHGPWTLVEAGVVRNRTLTSWPSLKTDIENAGGHWVDREVQVCDGEENVIVSSRKPDDLPAFCAQMVQTFAESLHRTPA